MQFNSALPVFMKWIEKHKQPTRYDPQQSRQFVFGKSIQYGMTLSHSKGDSTSATTEYKAIQDYFFMRWEREEKDDLLTVILRLIVDPVFTPCCLLLAPCSFTGPATQRSCKSTRKGNYKKHTSIIDSRIRINQIYKHQYAIETHAYRSTWAFDTLQNDCATWPISPSAGSLH